MTPVSLGSIWDETVAVLRREKALLVPVALAIFGPVQLLMGQAASAMAATTRDGMDTPPPPDTLLLIPALLLSMFGYMVVALLTVRPGISVGEALRESGRSLPGALLATLLAVIVGFAAALIVMIAATIGITIFGTDPATPQMSMQLVVLFLIPMCVIWVRMLMLPAVAACETHGPVDMLRRAWSLSRNNVLRLLGIWLLALFLGLIVALIEKGVIRALFELLKLVVGSEDIPNALNMIVGAAIEAMLSLVFAAYIALVYRRLAEV